MNTTLCSNWTGFAASIPGSGHIRRGLPCQDASCAITSPRPALIVCDGRGSAKASQDGAQAAVKAFQTQLAIFEPMLSSILDNEKAQESQWKQFARIMYRTLMQVKLDLSAERNVPENEFDFTVAFAVIGTHGIGCFQVGDGAIVLRQNGELQTAFLPDKGDFANQTHFLRENGEAMGKFQAALFTADENTGISITSDGPEHLMFKLRDMKPGRIFNSMMDDLHDGNLSKQDIMDYLTRRDWENDPRGADDRSIAILSPVTYPAAAFQNENQEDTQSIGCDDGDEPSVQTRGDGVEPSVQTRGDGVEPSVQTRGDSEASSVQARGSSEASSVQARGDGERIKTIQSGRSQHCDAVERPAAPLQKPSPQPTRGMASVFFSALRLLILRR